MSVRDVPIAPAFVDKLCGLSNPSGANHCFVNVVVQALWHCRPFRKVQLLTCSHSLPLWSRAVSHPITSATSSPSLRTALQAILSHGGNHGKDHRSAHVCLVPACFLCILRDTLLQYATAGAPKLRFTRSTTPSAGVTSVSRLRKALARINATRFPQGALPSVHHNNPVDQSKELITTWGAVSIAGRMGDSAEVLHTILQQLHYSYSLVGALATEEPEPDGSTTKGVSSRSRSSGAHHTNGSDMPNAECTSDPCVAHSLFWYESVQAAPPLALQH